MVNFVKLQYLDKFSEEKYQILTIVEFIRNRLNTIDINNPSTKKQKEFFEIFKENNMELSDIFIDKIIISAV